MSTLTALVLSILALPVANVANAQIFKSNCQPLTTERSDPIVAPGQASGHVHAIVGGTGFQRLMTADTVIDSLDTTCDKKQDHSNYWQPQIYHMRADGTFEIVEYKGATIYYLNRGCDYAPGRTRCPSDFNATSIPAGMRILVGNSSFRAYTPNDKRQDGTRYICLQASGQPSIDPTYGFPLFTCKQMRAQVFFPSCWDGINLDSPDHTSHMAFPAYGNYNGGVCPPTHPIQLISLFYEFWYNTAPFPDGKFVLSNGDPTGYGLHADFLNGWNQTALDNAIATCKGPLGSDDPNCSAAYGKGPAKKLTPDNPLPITENVGLLKNVLAALPGNNLVTFPL